ncbi:hypothetical protein FPV16_17885 [Methylobacterium sp. W2]|uniref:hypothetical protein n=1 Tax=Methylobacterium sp. W2 TaxID=2598107 RepID=UPI001D0C1776|nr:hypothetical protein [Methylobacterium sp. W2]MCC0808058.1 hypothetical protein [Methylobacterium sp. W2]
MIPAADAWGPFAPGLPEAERRAQLRALRALSKVYAGPRAAALCQLLAQAETDTAALEPASRALHHLEPLDWRRILSSFANLSASA